MTDDIQKARSPNSPRIELSEALTLTKALYDKIGRSAVSTDVALGPLGYSSMSGASLSVLGALSQYGLIERKSGTVQITPLAVKIFHPMDSTQKDQSIREAALAPRIFQEIREKWHDMVEDVLANHLVHQRFTPDAARRAASVYKTNAEFAKLGSTSIDNLSQTKSETPTNLQTGNATDDIQKARSPNSPRIELNKVLATFKIPIGGAEAEITFTGEQLHAEDFDALSDYVALFKKQYIRKAGLESAAAVRKIHEMLADAPGADPDSP